MKNIIALLLLSCAFVYPQHTGVTLEDNQTITSIKTFSAGLCNSASGPLDVVACYGADPTGVADSTTALNKAFAAAPNAPRFIPAGVYKISGTLNVDTRYKVQGAAGSGRSPSNTIIQAAAGFSGTMAKIVSTFAQTTTVLGGMDGIEFDCQAHASVGVLYGGHAIFTTYAYQTQNTIFHNCRTAGAQVGANAWLLNWVNVSFQGNGGDGLQILDRANMGENLNCFGCGFTNNTGNGLTMGPATLAQHDLHCFSCSFDVNGGWDIQNQTATAGDSLVDLEGSYIFQYQKWIQNFGRMTINGAFFNDGKNSGTLGYLIDNEGLLQAFGGRWVNSGGGTIFNGSQSGITNCYSVATIAKTSCSSWIDGGSGNALFGGLTLGGHLSLGATTVKKLPSAAAFPGTVYYVIDSTSVASEGQTCLGGSSNKALAFSNGSVWKCF